jgi:peptidoglycan hydrolase-like protein with peptidoglycan-binding domain
VPHVFIFEDAFHDNEKEESLLLIDENLKKIAIAKAKVICDFYKVKYVEEKKEETKIILPTLKLGSKGEDLKKLQQKLKDLGYVITVDGDFGIKTETVVKQFQKDNGLIDDGIVGKNTWSALDIAKPKQATPTPIRKYEIIKEKNGINIVKINKQHLKKIDVILGKQPKETMASIYKRLSPKPSFLINGGLFGMSNGVSISTMFDEGQKIVSGYFSDFGLYVKQDGSYGFDNFNNVKDIKDFIGASPTLIINGVKSVDLKGLTKDKGFTDVRHPRTCIAIDENYFYLIIVDGRKIGKKGMNINELVDFGLKMKFQFMINLDGGYSSQLLGQDGKLINEYYEGRAIDNAIAFYL